jgi:sporulation protein YlmC with PRC-barrel domain
MEAVQQHHNQDFDVFENGKQKTIRVPVFSLADMGEVVIYYTNIQAIGLILNNKGL